MNWGSVFVGAIVTRHHLGSILAVLRAEANFFGGWSSQAAEEPREKMSILLRLV